MRTLMVCFFSLFSVSPAFAVDNQTCMNEAMKLCPGKTMNTGLAKCAREHRSEFSKACQAKGEAMKNEIESAIAACKADVAKLCKDVKPGGGAIIHCLVENDAKLSAGCKAHVDKAIAAHAPMPNPQKAGSHE